jgi:tetratricopeptide (TPR) repeat protein
VRYLEEARTLWERLGHRKYLVVVHLNLGIVHFKLGKWELCEENLAAAESLARELGESQQLVRIQLAQGNLALRRCRWEDAKRLYTQALEVARTESYGRETVLAQEFLGEMHLERGEFEEASTLLEAALAQARMIAPEGDLVSESLRRLAETRLGQGRFEEALSHAKESAALASRIGDRYEEAVALRRDSHDACDAATRRTFC